MLSEQKNVKKPSESDRPFPWRCCHCGRVDVIPTCIDYPAEVRYDGRLISFVARGIEIPTCQNCKEKVFTETVDDQINDALRTHLKLLTPAQIREGIEQLGLSQKQVSECLGIAEATLSRWLNNVVIQSRAMDNFLRLFFHVPQVRLVLSEMIKGACIGTTDVLDRNNNPPNKSLQGEKCTAGTNSTSSLWPPEYEARRKAYRPVQEVIERGHSTWPKRQVG